MMRIMAIDYGQRKVGIAMSDELGVISQPLMTLRAKSQKEFIKRLKFIVKENNVGLILVGNPVSHSGKSTPISQEILRFVEVLEKSIAVEVKLWDERFTSRYASRILKEKGIKQKGNIDQIAASLMLEEYLRTHSGNSV
jgi:putative Holliday junction resolvase